MSEGQIKNEDYPFLCSPTVKVTFHNTFETALMAVMVFVEWEMRNHEKRV